MGDVTQIVDETLGLVGASAKAVEEHANFKRIIGSM